MRSQRSKGSRRATAMIIDTIPVLVWCNLPDGSNEFLKVFPDRRPAARDGKPLSIPTTSAR